MNPTHQQFFGLLRLALDGTPFTAEPGEEEWTALYRMAREQSLTGLIFAVAASLPEAQQPPTALAMQWMSEAESIRGLNDLLYQEAARLTRLFADAGRKTAILKGQANARLYPDKFSRQPGDIDIWVSGGRESVVALLKEMNALSEDRILYHHAHMISNDPIKVDVHFRPSSGNFNPFTNRRLQRWLEREIQDTTAVSEGFNVPSVRFALVMQLAHIQRHFLASGIGLRHVVDYYWLLREATADDLFQVERLLHRFGLNHMAGALMWVIGEVLELGTVKMIGEPDNFRGEWMLREIMAGGNFGRYAKPQQYGLLRRVLEVRRRRLRLMRFDFREVFWLEVRYWKALVRTLPTRIRYRTLSLKGIPR